MDNIKELISVYSNKNKIYTSVIAYLSKKQYPFLDEITPEQLDVNLTFFIMNQINNKFPINEDKYNYELSLGNSFDINFDKDQIKSLVKSDEIINKFCECIMMDKCYLMCINVLESEEIKQLVDKNIWNQIYHIFRDFTTNEMLNYKSILFKLLFINQCGYTTKEIKKCYREVLNDDKQISEVVKQLVQQIIYDRVATYQTTKLYEINNSDTRYRIYNQVFTFSN
jgi:hypothetical protein